MTITITWHNMFTRPIFENQYPLFAPNLKKKKKLFYVLISFNVFIFFQVEEEVGAFVADWEKGNGQAFLIHGLPFPEYVKKQWEDFYLRREQEKQNRVMSHTILNAYYKYIASLYLPLPYIPLSGQLQSAFHEPSECELGKTLHAQFVCVQEWERD